MRLMTKAVGAALLLGLSLFAAPGAQALPFITGSATINGFVTNIPNAPTTSIVSQLNSFTQGPSFGVGSCIGIDFAGCTNANAGILNILSGTGVYSFANSGGDVFTFTVTGITSAAIRTPLAGSNGSLVDGFSITAQGGVTDSLSQFNPSAFNLSYGATGSCTGTNGPPATCTTNPSGGFTASLSALAQPPPPVPEPASLTLLGAGLVGLGAIRRKFAKKS